MLNKSYGKSSIQQGETLELLDSSWILAMLSTASRQQLSRLDVLDRVDSTNCYAWTQPEFKGSYACLAEYQWAGRGRQGKRWVSPYSSGLCLSIKHPYLSDTPLFPLDGLSIALAIAVAQLLRELGIREIGLKWPNDIFWQKRKLAGLLLESQHKKNRREVVVGIGMNVKIPITQEFNQAWVDLYTIQGEATLSRNLLAAQLIDCCLETLMTYPDRGLTALLPVWQRLDLLKGQQVTLLQGQQWVSGIAQGIDKQGALWLETTTGSQRFVCGEVKIQWSN